MISPGQARAPGIKRAAELVGGAQQLALRLKVTPSHLALWLAGVETPPPDVFLRAVDIVMDQPLPSAVKRPDQAT